MEQSQQIDEPIVPEAFSSCDPHSLKVISNDGITIDVSCPICFTILDKPRSLTCKHVFCEQCIKQWCDSVNKTCPMCRVGLKKTRGSYGKKETALGKRIQKMDLECRNCKWSGKRCDYLREFGKSPYLDDLAEEKEKKCLEDEVISCEEKVCKNIDENTIKIFVEEKGAVEKEDKAEQTQKKQEPQNSPENNIPRDFLGFMLPVHGIFSPETIQNISLISQGQSEE